MDDVQETAGLAVHEAAAKLRDLETLIAESQADVVRLGEEITTQQRQAVHTGQATTKALDSLRKQRGDLVARVADLQGVLPEWQQLLALAEAEAASAARLEAIRAYNLSLTRGEALRANLREAAASLKHAIVGYSEWTQATSSAYLRLADDNRTRRQWHARMLALKGTLGICVTEPLMSLVDLKAVR